MSATILAAKLDAEWNHLSSDGRINREAYIRNLLLAFEAKVRSETIASFSAASSLKNSDADNGVPVDVAIRHKTPVDQCTGAAGKCHWIQNETYGYWEGDCGLVWKFTNGTPKTNGFSVCPGCGQIVI